MAAARLSRWRLTAWIRSLSVSRNSAPRCSKYSHLRPPRHGSPGAFLGRPWGQGSFRRERRPQANAQTYRKIRRSTFIYNHLLTRRAKG
jgi:hypothetical protein